MDSSTLTALLVIAAVIAVILIIIVAFRYLSPSRQRSKQLRERFGPEYDYLVEEVGDRQKAEAELEGRLARVKALDIHPLRPEEHRRFSEAWRSTQAHFVDNPATTLAEADRLVTELMQTRGYPMDDFEQRAADVSVDHPHVVMNYREARTILRRNDHNEADTEDLRQALVHYRALFDDLLETDDGHKPQVEVEEVEEEQYPEERRIEKETV